MREIPIMTKLLVLKSSPNGDYSKSSQLADNFKNLLADNINDLRIAVRDLSETNVPHLNPVTLSGFFTNPAEHTDEQKSAISLSEEMIEELESADIIVIGAAMHNYMVTSGLKAYIDQVTRAGKTFNYTDTGPVGLLKNKKVYVVKTSGGDYSAEPMKSMDYLQPYLTFVLGFIGLNDVSFINHGGAAMGEEMAKAADARSENAIVEAVKLLLTTEFDTDKTVA